MEFLAIFILVGLGAVGVFIWQQTRAKGRWGLGAWRTKCPRCSAPLPMIRKPASSEEMMWGGWTCPSCGCKVDKYGRERTPA